MLSSSTGSIGSPYKSSSPSLFSLPPSYIADNDSSAHSSRSGSLQTGQWQDVYKALGLMETDDAKSDAEQERLVNDLIGPSSPSNSAILSAPITIIGGIPAPELIQLELFRENTDKPFKEIQPESFDWTEISKQSESAFVVRLKTLVNESEPEFMLSVIQSCVHAEPAIDVVAKFHELSVAENAPKRYESRILFVYEKATDYNPERFGKLMSRFLPKNNFPYFTIEYLDSFLARKQFANGDIDGEQALKLLKHHVAAQLPCSSLFLKLSAHYPEECVAELEALAKVNTSMPLTHLGERSLHKLAVSVVNKMKSPEGSLKKAMSILKLGVEPREWGYVAFNTLLRLAQDEDELILKRNKSAVSQVDLLLNLINVSNLDLLDKVALLMMAGRTPKAISEASDYLEVQQALRRINNVCSDRRESKAIHSDDLEFTLELLSLGSTSSCHLVSIILRKCVDHSAFTSGWKIASRMISISKQVFGEVVTLCSKAYFASVKRDKFEELGEMWFRRIQWCVERHLPFLNRYPCGLALHVAAHRRDFECCWRWFSSMREQLAFRLTGYHTSAVLKAASFEDEPDIDKVRDAYGMTPSSEKTTFTFIPLVRIWENLSNQQRAKSLDFWDEVSQNVRTCLDGQDCKKSEPDVGSPSMDSREAAEMALSGGNSGGDSQLERVIQKLNNWIDSFVQWKRATSNGADLSKVHSRRASNKSQGSGGGSARGSARGSGNYSNRRNSKHRGSGGKSNLESAHLRNSDHALSPQGSVHYLHRRQSENSVGLPSISAPPFIMPATKGFHSDDGEAARRWSGNTDPVVVAKAISLNKPRASDRRSSGTTPKMGAAISRPGSGNAVTLGSMESNPNSRGSSVSASPQSSRNGSVQFGFPPVLKPNPSPSSNTSPSTTNYDKFDSDANIW